MTDLSVPEKTNNRLFQQEACWNLYCEGDKILTLCLLKCLSVKAATPSYFILSPENNETS